MPLISILGLALAIALPWWAGYIWARAMLPRLTPGVTAIAIGCGYFIGVMITTNVLRLFALTESKPDFWWVLLWVSCAGIAALAARRWFAAPALPSPTAKYTNSTAISLVASLILVLTLCYYWVLGSELLTRPLFAWDAWMNWAPKAIIWFKLENLSPFVSPEDWLAAGTASQVHTLGNYIAWRYPESVPLQILWMMLALDDSDNPLVYISWLLVAINMAIVFYGFLRAREVPASASVIFACLLSSVPYLNVHTVLAGYADIWVCACFGIAALALAQWHRDRSNGLAALALLFALFCIQLKVPGVIFGGIVVALWAAIAMPLASRWKWCLAGAACLMTIVVMIVGFSWIIPGIGLVEISSDVIAIPYFGQYTLTIYPVHGEVVKALFIMMNWNLLWYLVVAAFLLQLLPSIRSPQTGIDAAVLLVASTVLLLIFVCTGHYLELMNFTTFNRYVLYLLLPAAAFVSTITWSVLASDAGSNQLAEATPGRP